MKLSFLGAAGEVTGSCYLVETGKLRFLVDCGMFQGGADAAPKNQHAFPFSPESIDFVLLTHAHIDHSGLLPRLAAQGFRGPIYATPATIDLIGVLLPDSAHIQEKEIEWLRKARPNSAAEPLYTVIEAENCLSRCIPVEYEQSISPHAAVRCRFRDAGHILGSASLEVWVSVDGNTRKIVFSGDLGQPGYHVVRGPAAIEQADILLIESTYGDRLHKNLAETTGELVAAIRDTFERKGGNVIIPAFAVGRTQDLLLLLAKLCQGGELANLNIYVDSPMASKATEITMRHRELFGKDAEATLRWLFSHQNNPNIRFVQDVQESIALNRITSNAIIISASGMCDAGRIKHHLKLNLPRKQCTVLITGFQAQGTLGRRLVDGAKTVRIFGDEIEVAADIYTIGGLSAHADQQGLIDWLGHFASPPRQTYVIHGEPASAASLAARIESELRWNVEIPKAGQRVEIK